MTTSFQVASSARLPVVAVRSNTSPPSHVELEAPLHEAPVEPGHELQRLRQRGQPRPARKDRVHHDMVAVGVDDAGPLAEAAPGTACGFAARSDRPRCGQLIALRRSRTGCRAALSCRIVFTDEE